jgi:TPR repeat protein
LIIICGRLVAGVRYATGQFVIKDDLKAVELFQAAAGQGLANAQRALGISKAEE